MKLSDLPSMLVERIERDTAEVRIVGRFDRLAGVRDRGYFRLSRGGYAWADLVITDRDSGAVVVTTARDPDIARLRVGERYTWLDDYWQAPFVEAIADESTMWRPFTFKPSDARYFRQGESVGWRKATDPLPTGATELGVKADGWDHEHCDLCNAQIDRDHPIGYTNDEGHFLCSLCYDKYGMTHDVSFQVGP